MESSPFATAIASRISCRSPTAGPSTPDGAVYARDATRSKEMTGLVEWLIPGFRDSRVGVSGWFGNIDSVRVDGLGRSSTLRRRPA